MRPGFGELRYTVEVDTDAPASELEDIRRIVERTSLISWRGRSCIGSGGIRSLGPRHSAFHCKRPPLPGAMPPKGQPSPQPCRPASASGGKRQP